MDRLATFELPPQPEQRVHALERLVEILWLTVQDLQDSFVVERKAAPFRLIEGTVRVADGTNWNPGAGAGLYEFRGGTWNKM